MVQSAASMVNKQTDRQTQLLAIAVYPASQLLHVISSKALHLFQLLERLQVSEDSLPCLIVTFTCLFCFVKYLLCFSRVLPVSKQPILSLFFFLLVQVVKMFT